MGRMSQDLDMRSRVHPQYKTKYRVNNWGGYERALVQRGDITLWILEDASAAWKPEPSGLRGAQRKFSNHAIETALTLRLIFKLPLRQAEGFLRSILSLMGVGLEAPDHATLARELTLVRSAVSYRMASGYDGSTCRPGIQTANSMVPLPYSP